MEAGPSNVNKKTNQQKGKKKTQSDNVTEGAPDTNNKFWNQRIFCGHPASNLMPLELFDFLFMINDNHMPRTSFFKDMNP